MYLSPLVPDHFDIPSRVETDEFVLVPLTSKLIAKDIEVERHADLWNTTRALANHDGVST